VETRFDRAKATQEVRRLILAYPWSVDRGDIDGVVRLLEGVKLCTTEDDEEAVPVLGADDVRRMYSGVILYDGLPHTKHVITNIDIWFSDDGSRADSRSHYVVLQGLVDFPLQVIITGRYEDTFEFDGHAWRLRIRREAADIIGDLSRHVKPELLSQIQPANK
jgi:SnoaL-like domain